MSAAARHDIVDGVNGNRDVDDVPRMKKFLDAMANGGYDRGCVLAGSAATSGETRALRPPKHSGTNDLRFSRLNCCKDRQQVLNEEHIAH